MIALVHCGIDCSRFFIFVRLRAISLDLFHSVVIFPSSNGYLKTAVNYYERAITSV